jgi:hypothetical protein
MQRAASRDSHSQSIVRAGEEVQIHGIDPFHGLFQGGFRFPVWMPGNGIAESASVHRLSGNGFAESSGVFR